MTASKLAWVTAFAGVLVALGIAVSAAGMIPALGAHSGAAVPAGHPAGTSSNWSASTYSVSFGESGLPNGTFWAVNLHPAGWLWSVAGYSGPGMRPQFHGFGWNGSSNSSVGFLLPNGTYDFGIHAVQANGTLYSASPSVGNLTVNGTNVSVAVSFAPTSLYNVTFVETGLPNGTFWSVFLHGAGGSGYWGPAPSAAAPACFGGSGWNASTGSSIGFAVPDGTYPFFVPAAWTSSGVYFANPGTGNVTVNGSSVTVDVSFTTPSAYNISFSETGLPNGTNWTVFLFGGGWGHFGANTSASATIGFARTNGTYFFGVPDVWTSGGVYRATPSRGNFTVNGTAVSVAVSFALVTYYNVTFVETGLPNGTNWSAVLFGSGWGSVAGNVSSTSSLTVARPDGTYRFVLGPVWNATGFFSASPGIGNVTVNGSSVLVNVTFTFTSFSSGWSPASSALRSIDNLSAVAGASPRGD